MRAAGVGRFPCGTGQPPIHPALAAQTRDKQAGDYEISPAMSMTSPG